MAVFASECVLLEVLKVRMQSTGKECFSLTLVRALACIPGALIYIYIYTGACTLKKIEVASQNGVRLRAWVFVSRA